ncbi:MAG: Protein export cytoplasm protein SecA ATPase RNA helicase (TC 3.A.5.1.1) [uncultured Sulfurovum sp.]|uniref:Protein translocase subunit SecA n=1 Tax=uncultured Sulfurovum sp. TaxID=269237 RepID=A0A6S6T1Z9_9BACT|nr:MAG: Protein export cytoplasm protein SecA ATPase RNA helicase (TC 3.A.5.1.1) [uncultured Sulfurovum sp.]
MSILSQKYQQTKMGKELKPLTGFDAQVNSFFASIRSFYPHHLFLFREAKKIHKLSLTYELLNEEQLFKKIEEIRVLFRLGKMKQDKKVLHQGIALVCEASFRSLKIRPYTVQIMGALAMYKNFIIQMHTGEGKTVTAALSGVLHAWSGKPCHVVTSNDYLALRDATTMEALYTYCHLSVGKISPEMQSEERVDNYKKSVVYATSNSILADFLRDQMESNYPVDFNNALINFLQKQDVSNQVLQGLHTIIIDEADSVLADEATTPLIISVPRENKPLKEAILSAKEISEPLEKGVDYEVNIRHKEVYLTHQGESYIDRLTEHLAPIWKSRNRREYLLKQALMAREFYIEGVHYIIDEGKLVIVDEKTGRLMPDRSWSAGMHQAVEAKENIEMSDPTETHIKMSFQRFFRLYENVSGMSGTLQKLKNELWHIYGLTTLKIPKRISNQYTILSEKIVGTKKEKWILVLEDIEKVYERGQPILIGTRSVQDSESLSRTLQKKMIPHQVLNALSHEQEAHIIQEAGHVYAVTIATNMAGRGTDIKLSQESIDLGGLHVISTERHDSRRIDMQLFGRSARQGEPGTVQAIVSLEDELLVKKSSKWIRERLQKKMNSFIWRKIALLFYKRIQNKSDKQASKMRKKILFNDFSMKKMLSFSMK